MSSFVGSAVEVVLGTAQNPAAVDVVVPSGATGVFIFYTLDGFNVDGEKMGTATLAGANPTNSYDLPSKVGYYPATGARYWRVSTTGTKSLAVAWTAAPVEGPTCYAIFTSGEPAATGWGDIDAAQGIDAGAVTVTLTTAIGELIAKYDQRYDTNNNPPTLSSGWTNQGTTAAPRQSENARLSSITAAAATQVCNSENESYSSILAITIPDEAADTTAPTLTSPTGTATGSTTADGTVSTDEANGTAYAVVTTSATAPTAAQVRAGQDNTGAAAAWGGSQAVSTAGTKTFNATGLTASTAYYFHFHHRDAANNDSTVVSSAQFTTTAGASIIKQMLMQHGG